MTMQNKTIRLTVAILAMGAAIAFGTRIVVSSIASDDSAKYGDSSSHGVVSDAGVSTTALSLEEILAKLNEQGFTEVYEIEREGDVYEVEVLDPKLGKVELYLDPRTGQVLRKETHD